MKKMVILVGLAFMLSIAMAQDNPYIVKTKGVKKTEKEAADTTAQQKEDDGPTDFMGRNFRFYSMCDWKEGMRFMVIPEKYDLLVNTFRDAATDKEVSSGKLRHKIMVYKGHEELQNGRVHVKFTCADNNHDYYYELPSGTFDDYCYGKLGVPTLAYLGDVDRARELLTDQVLLTRAQKYRVDTEYDGDGYKEVTVDKNMPVTVKAVGVGTRSFPVKIVVEDEYGNQFYQNVALSKTNCGMRDDEFVMGNEIFLFAGSFDFTGANMAVSDNVKEYLTKTVHTRHTVSMSSKGSGKVRDVKVPRFTGFIIDEIEPIKNSRYYTLTLRETESRRIYYKDVAFREDDVVNNPGGKIEEDYFGDIFGMGEGIAHHTSKETRAAIREGRVIRGMSEDEVLLAMGEPYSRSVNSDGVTQWLYARSNGKILFVFFNKKGVVSGTKVTQGMIGGGASVGGATAAPSAPTNISRGSRAASMWNKGTPL